MEDRFNDLETKAKEYLRSRGYILAPLFHIWDIQQAAKDNFETELTDAEAMEIAERIDHKCDCEIGINWEVINFYIEEFIDKNGK